jgi:hypothetical protein
MQNLPLGTLNNSTPVGAWDIRSTYETPVKVGG